MTSNERAPVPAEVDAERVEAAEDAIDGLIMKHATDAVWINDSMTIGDLTRDMARVALQAGDAPSLDADALMESVETMGWQFDEAWKEEGEWTVYLRRSEPNPAAVRGRMDTFTASLADAVAKAGKGSE